VIVSPIPVAVLVAKVYAVAERPLIVVVAKYPLSTFPDHVRLVPAVIRDDGVLKNDDQSVVDAVSGTEYPTAVPRVSVCTPVDVEVVIVKLRPPEVDVANDCVAAVEPFNDVIVPPAPPASVPQ
jgi:hypothetical protein